MGLFSKITNKAKDIGNDLVDDVNETIGDAVEDTLKDVIGDAIDEVESRAGDVWDKTKNELVGDKLSGDEGFLGDVKSTTFDLATKGSSELSSIAESNNRSESVNDVIESFNKLLKELQEVLADSTETTEGIGFALAPEDTLMLPEAEPVAQPVTGFQAYKLSQSNIEEVVQETSKLLELHSFDDFSLPADDVIDSVHFNDF